MKMTCTVMDMLDQSSFRNPLCVWSTPDFLRALATSQKRLLKILSIKKASILVQDARFLIYNTKIHIYLHKTHPFCAYILLKNDLQNPGSLVTGEEDMVLEESWLADILIKVGMFALVQALVYLILSNSSNIFSKNKTRSLSFKPARSVSIRRILAAISDIPAGGEPSPSTRDSSLSDKDCPIRDDSGN